MHTPLDPASQLYVDKLRLEESQPGAFDSIKSLADVGDIVGVVGSIKRTEKGELSVVAANIKVTGAKSWQGCKCTTGASGSVSQGPA